MDLIAYLRADAARLRQVAAGHLELPVPSCPGWTVADLVDHVAGAYVHKTACIRLGERPRPWPPADWAGYAPDPVARLDRALAELLDEFERHAPDDPAFTWYPPDQTVGFWIRRMAQETAVHRVDVELALDQPATLPTPLALDGIDEVLTIFLGWETTDTVAREGVDAVPALARADERVVEVSTGGRAWSVRPTTAGVEVRDGGTPDAAARVTGAAAAVLLWLWGRYGDDTVSFSGDRKLVAYLRELSEFVTQ